MPDYVVTSWNALSAPAGTADDILAISTSDIVDGAGDPDVAGRRRCSSASNARGSTPEEMQERMARDIERWGEVIEKAGLRQAMTIARRSTHASSPARAGDLTRRG